MSIMETVGFVQIIRSCRKVSKRCSAGHFDGVFGVFDDFRHYSMVFENFVGS